MFLGTTYRNPPPCHAELLSLPYMGDPEEDEDRATGPVTPYQSRGGQACQG